MSSTPEEMRLVTVQGVKDAPLPATYEAAKTALAQCTEVDECSTWAKKAAALASYARQAGDKSLENMSMRIRARAVRRCGELLKEIEPGRPGPKSTSAPGQNSRSAVAEASGLSKRQKETALAVASTPAADFDTAVESENPPTITELAEAGTKRKPLVDLEGRDPEEFNAAIHLRARMADLASGCSSVSPEAFLRGCLPQHHAPTRERAELISKWVSELLDLLG